MHDAPDEFTEPIKRKRPVSTDAALSPIRRAKTAADEVGERLIMAIARREILPGERVTEASLAATLNVSRVPVREALQKLLLRGILVGGARRDLRIMDHSEERLAELYELRFAIEKIILEQVMAAGRDNTKLLAELERIVGDMEKFYTSGDPVKLSAIDLEFHRTVALHSGNRLGTQIWDGLAQHMLIVFSRDWSQASNLIGEVQLHETMIEFLRNGSTGDIDAVLRDHYKKPKA
jgi:DNA-binding GntR family transcriptional regulator